MFVILYMPAVGFFGGGVLVTNRKRVILALCCTRCIRVSYSITYICFCFFFFLLYFRRKKKHFRAYESRSTFWTWTNSLLMCIHEGGKHIILMFNNHNKADPPCHIGYWLHRLSSSIDHKLVLFSSISRALKCVYVEEHCGMPGEIPKK